MPVVEFDAMPANARVWIFAADRQLSNGERDRLLERVDGFLAQWKAHGAPLTAARDWRYEQFLFVGVDEAAAGVSGCSIDALVNGLKALEADLDTRLIDHSPVLYRDNGEILRVSRGDFAELAQAGAVTPQTTVFNNTLTSMGQVRDGKWEGPAADSWHGQAFFDG
jgi:hypothetical protein